MKEIVETSKPISEFTEYERIRGKDEYRYTSVYSPTNQIPEGWCQLNRIIHVERYFENKINTHHTNSFYISSVKSNDAKLFAKGVRGHWLIENKLHYVKDAIMREDYINNNSKDLQKIHKKYALIKRQYDDDYQAELDKRKKKAP